MKRFILNKIKISHLKNTDAIVGGADTHKIAHSDIVKDCKTEICASVNAFQCTNTTIGGEPATKP
ncbi:hypothetical protein IMCC3317_30330 [Kordia antarctica]|uniref:Uncharacterized protein n=1 Tax=Kordia antarctica TaxID=1218801 RepID=A0A7L4ZLX5_9FLAO|nr:hypothetical protein [Kordia antarctica]QHI37652.1 hypothetical protein IMCC3317_30330 [Kordia antarctica]